MASVQKNLEQPNEDALQGRPEALAAKHTTQLWLFVALMAGFAVKTPIVPFHTWLPAAYNEAPSASPCCRRCWRSSARSASSASSFR